MDDNAPDRWDRAIDEAARALTAGDPSPRFRAAVIARVATAGRRRERRAWLLVPLAVAAVLAGLLVVRHEYRGSRDALVPPPVQGGDIALGVSGSTPVAAGIATQHRGTSTQHPSTQQPAPTPIEPSPLSAQAPPPLAVAPLVIDSLDPDSIHLDPLQPIASIAIAPLDPEGDQP